MDNQFEARQSAARIRERPKVGGTVYVVLYTPPLGVSTVKYAEGRNLLVVVGEKTISYNDLLGQSFEVPIISHQPGADTGPPK